MLEIEQVAHVHPWSAALLADSFGERYLAVGLWQIAPDQDAVLQGFYIADGLLDESTLHNICVHPRGQGKGWGRQLLADYLQRSALRGSQQWWLEVRASNTRARQLYERAGYQQVGLRRGYYRQGDGRSEDACVMQRLSSADPLV